MIAESGNRINRSSTQDDDFTAKVLAYDKDSVVVYTLIVVTLAPIVLFTKFQIVRLLVPQLR